ncbi:MAG: hypothetical protein P9M14_15990 [Candidatus Alcyoniella australis]|nr:hypothetical protein [Candidatus Alcyoniella australis]
MKRTIALVLLILMVGGCSLRSSHYELDQLEAQQLDPQLAALDLVQLEQRMNGLFTELCEGKMTIQLTNAKIAEFFADDDQRSTFIAVMADLLREADFRRQKIDRFKLGTILIEPNGVIAHAEVTYWGHFYFIWNAKVRQVITWKKEEGTWYAYMPMRPQED